MLVRHAAIYANDFDWEEYIEPFVQKLQNTTVYWRGAGPLAFLEKWQSPISDEELEDLTSVGKLESYQLGVDGT
jgi:acid phosphatase